MQLTPEERRRIYEEEKAKLERKPSLAYSAGWHTQRVLRAMKSRPVVPLLLLVVSVGVLVYWLNTGSSSTPNTPPPAIYSRPATLPIQPTATPSNPAPTARAYDPVNDNSEEGIKLNILAAAESKITYEQLKKNAQRYDGEPWVFTGRVFQIQESGGQTLALVSLDAWGSKIVAAKANFTTDFVEKDQVYVVGYVTENYSYTSVAGWNLSVPAVDARAILKPAEAARIRVGKKNSKQ